MSVTILSTAQAHTPVYNNQNLVASSTNSAQPNFKYVVTVQINDGLYSDDVKLKIPARPDNSKLYFNPQKVVESYVFSSFYTGISDFFFPNPSIPSSFKKVTIGVNEEYGMPVSGFGGASGSYFVWNGAYDSLDFADYVYSTSSVSKDLTLSPNLTDTIYYDQRYLFKTWHRGFSTNDNRYLTIKSYNSANALIQNLVIENPFYSIGIYYSNNYIGLNCSPYALNNFFGVIISASSPGLNIPLATSYYTLEFSNTSSVVSSNIYTVNIKTCGSRYKKYALHFLNKLGNYDSFTFDLLNRYNTDKNTDMYKKIPYTLNSSDEYRYEKDTNDTVIYNTVLTNKITLNTDWISDDQSIWLRDLFMSPDIKLETLEDPTIAGDQSSLISVRVQEKSYETKIQNNDKCFNIAITVENSLQDVRQRC